MASLSDSEILEQYKLARDAIVTAIAEGSHSVEYRVGSRQVRRTDPAVALREIERIIGMYETKVAGAAYGRARNYVEFHRR
jgi:hypothetical protein